MTDFTALQAACRKKISQSARLSIKSEIECCRAMGLNPILANALEFLLERENQIDAALAFNSPTRVPGEALGDA